MAAAPSIPLDNPSSAFQAVAEDEPTPEVAVAIGATPIPTATPIPAVLQVRGTLAYVVREGGQDDIWGGWGR